MTGSDNEKWFVGKLSRTSVAWLSIGHAARATERSTWPKDSRAPV